MNAAIKKASDRLDEVIKKGKEVLATKRAGPIGDVLQDERGYIQFRLLAKSVLRKLDPNGHFEGEFNRVDAQTGWASGPAYLIADQLGVLEALRVNFDDGVADDDEPDYESNSEPERSRAPEDDARPLVFISCGQFTRQEIYLGKQIAKLVEVQTGAVGYFAQNQNSLDGLTDHIFGALDKAAGFIAVMHKRGQVTNEKGELHRTRASVWIEQEIAIASFVQRTRNANLRVQAYVEKGIALEGARDKLMLNPKEFTSNSQITKHLKNELTTWKLASPMKIEVTVSYEEWRELRQDWNPNVLHKYMLKVTITNKSQEAVPSYFATLQFPHRFITNGAGTENEAHDRRTRNYRYFREDSSWPQNGTLEPGQSKQLFRFFEYHVSEDQFHGTDWGRLEKLTAEVKVYVNNKLAGFDSKTFEQLNKF
jgi:hypothetical protein